MPAARANTRCSVFLPSYTSGALVEHLTTYDANTALHHRIGLVGTVTCPDLSVSSSKRTGTHAKTIRCAPPESIEATLQPSVG